MSVSISPSPYSLYLQPAFAGMKGDSMDDNVDTFACGPNPNGPMGFGLFVGRTAPHALTVVAGGTDCVGIALHDHTVASRGGYNETDAVSVLTRGRAWCQVDDAAASAVEDGIYVMYDPATGKAAIAGTAVPNAVFRSKAIAVYDITYTTTTNIALVEMHYPLAV